MMFYFSYFVYFLLSFVSLVAFYYIYSFSYWKRKDVDYLKPSFPYGNISDIIHNKKNFGLTSKAIYEVLKKKNTRFGGFWFVTKPILLVYDADLIKSVLIKNFSTFHDRGFFLTNSNDLLSDSLPALVGDRWKNLRNKLSPTFTSGKMKIMFGITQNCVDNMDEVLEIHVGKGEPVELKDLFSKHITDIIGSCVFGVDCNCIKNPNSQFLKIGKTFLEESFGNNTKLIIGFLFSKIFRYLNIQMTSDEVSDFLINVIKETIDYREKNNVVRKDYMDLLIKLKNNENVQDDDETEVKRKNEEYDKLTFSELVSTTFIFFIAGFEVITSAISYTFYELACNGDIQERLRMEILESLKNNNFLLTYKSVMDMKYLDQVICETLRKYPNDPNLMRRCNERFTLPGSNLTIEKDQTIWIPVYGIHHDPNIYPEPEKYNPDRFTEEEKKKRNPYHYLPFGDGPRHCIGNRFALFQMKMAVVAVLRKYKLEMHHSTCVPITFSAQGLMMRTDQKLYLNVTKCI